MAKADFRMPDDFLNRLSRLEERTDDVIPKVLEAGGKVALGQAQSNLRSVLSGKSSGQLERSLGLSPAKVDQNGDFNVKVGFGEPRRSGDANAKIASILEYGKHGQPPHPFMKPAKSASRTAALEAMKRKLEEELGE